MAVALTKILLAVVQISRSHVDKIIVLKSVFFHFLPTASPPLSSAKSLYKNSRGSDRFVAEGVLKGIAQRTPNRLRANPCV